jgi:hypothetical protein
MTKEAMTDKLLTHIVMSRPLLQHSKTMFSQSSYNLLVKQEKSSGWVLQVLTILNKLGGDGSR